MASSMTHQGGGEGAKPAVPREVRTWVRGLAISSLAVVVAGVLLAIAVPGVAKPWTGAAFVLAAGLALVVGASKTSSA